MLKLIKNKKIFIDGDGKQFRPFISVRDICRIYEIIIKKDNLPSFICNLVSFNSTIKDNISYGLANPTMEQIESAATQSQAMEFIEKLPNGFDTIVGERGQMLSGGQQQRIAIARTVIRNPDIIIFDEATSSVDNKTEQQNNNDRTKPTE